MGFPANPQAAQPSAGGTGQPPDPYQQAAQAYQSALSAAQQATAGPNIQQFMNPYTASVTEQTMADLERQRQMQGMQTAAQARQAGAFGGSRHGVADALTSEAFARQGAQTFANLNQQGFNTALQAAQQQQGTALNAASQLGSLANLGFGFGERIGQQQAQQGALQRQQMQERINAMQQQYSGFINAPQQALQLPMAALGAANMGQQTQTTTKQPGLIDYLAIAASLPWSDRRLKTNIQPLGERNGVKLYSWDWNEEGARRADPAQPTVGVMADELMETHPHLVHQDSDGYLRVNYAGLNL